MLKLSCCSGCTTTNAISATVGRNRQARLIKEPRIAQSLASRLEPYHLRHNLMAKLWLAYGFCRALIGISYLLIIHSGLHVGDNPSFYWHAYSQTPG